ncbi:3-hydroxyacyl-ACP dehydratase FabZ [Buchnera aphidicola]|uniref:3-hydroxyacyl-ACP dehydratase FabZ n=1 Tax=Buchnera aphidicola TaxID=9 RepID=UPI0031B69E1E
MSTINVIFNKNEIITVLPHRHPFLLVDKILELVKNKYVKTSKLIKKNDFFLKGHFPGFPILPGVYIMEMMAQSSCFLLLKSQEKIFPKDFYCLSSIEKCYLKSFVFPTQKVVINIFIKKKKNLTKLKGIAKVNNKIVCIAYFSCMKINKDFIS